jgi:hypothetical protein
MKKQYKTVLDCLEEYSDAVFDYGKIYSLYEHRPRVFKDNFRESRKQALALYKQLRREIRNLAKTAER